MTISTIDQILAHPDSHIAKLIKKAKELKKLTELFRHTLSTELSEHCHVTGLENGTLILAVDNAAWATQLRFSIPDIIKTLQTQPEFQTIKKIRYKKL